MCNGELMGGTGRLLSALKNSMDASAFFFQILWKVFLYKKNLRVFT